MTSRKVPLSHSPGPGFSRGGAPSKISLNPEFLEAVNVMNEATMLRACELLLSERDYAQREEIEGADQSSTGGAGCGGQGMNKSKSEEVMDTDDGTNRSEKSVSRMSDRSSGAEERVKNTKSDYGQLLDIYSKCQTALRTVNKHQATAAAASVSAPPSMSTLSPVPGSKSASLSSRGTGKVGSVARGMVSLPKLKPKSTMAPPPPMRGRVRNPVIKSPAMPKRKLLTRERSDSSQTGPKRVRLGAPSPPSLSNSEAMPPPSALDFLAKLNKDPSVKSSTLAPTSTPVPVSTKEESEEVGDDEVEEEEEEDDEEIEDEQEEEVIDDEEDEDIEIEEDDNDDGDDSDDDASATKKGKKKKESDEEPVKRRKNPPRMSRRR